VADALVLLLIAAFFGVCFALVRGCDHVIGADDAYELDVPEPRDTEPPDAAPLEAAAPEPDTEPVAAAR
jgi:hypothetical protein